MTDLTGRVAIVTGAGGGLGREHALLLARCGARVVVNDLGDAAERVVAEIRQGGGNAIAMQGSVTDASFVARMVDDTLSEWQRVDILINNAGILRDKSFAKMTFDEFRSVIDVHVMGAFHCTKGSLGHDARTKLRSHRDDDIVLRLIRQLRPGQLCRRKNGARRSRADSRA